MKTPPRERRVMPSLSSRVGHSDLREAFQYLELHRVGDRWRRLTCCTGSQSSGPSAAPELLWISPHSSGCPEVAECDR